VQYEIVDDSLRGRRGEHNHPADDPVGAILNGATVFVTERREKDRIRLHTCVAGKVKTRQRVIDGQEGWILWRRN